MKSRPKDLGTAHETRVVRLCLDAGLIAERIAEGGAYDIGDVRVYADEVWVLECKDKMRMNVHQELAKARRKARGERAAVVWRKMVRKPGNQNRTQDGPIVVALALDDFLDLLRGTG